MSLIFILFFNAKLNIWNILSFYLYFLSRFFFLFYMQINLLQHQKKPEVLPIALMMLCYRDNHLKMTDVEP